MSLSDENRALVGRVLPANTSLTNFTDFRCSHDALADLLAEARREAYHHGWNDREADLIAVVNRIVPDAARSEGSKPVPGWRPIESAPKDGTPIIARLANLDGESRWAHLSGRCFVVRHEGKTASGFDLGWSVHPGLGGFPDHWLAEWAPLPDAAAPPPPEGSKLLGDVEGLAERLRSAVTKSGGVDLRDSQLLLDAAEALSRRPSREEVARVIDPEAFCDAFAACCHFHSRRESALAKADALLALFSGVGGEAGPTPQEGEA